MRHKMPAALRIAAIIGTLALLPLLGACTAANTETAAPSGSPSGATTAEMTVRLLTPTQDAEVPAGTVTVEVETSGLTFTMPSNTNVPGEGHVHFTLDDRPFEMATEPRLVIQDVSPGRHTLKAELVQNDTESFDPPIEQEIEFTAK
ncbi:MAG: hypothetical protein ACYC6C_00550 [Coriobacteriia bacterium]